MGVQYKINMNEEGRPFPHYWEMSVGSCHATTLLRADVQEQIRKAHKDIGFQYIRFHGLLDDDMSVVIAPMPWAEPQISFFNIDRIFDFLLDVGMKPFIELGFMPGHYASTEQTTFSYKAFSSPPKNDSDWSNLIEQLTDHLIKRYGAKEVRSWFFEVWNEPNLRYFFDGTQEDYFHLYELTARAIKKVDPLLRVGGPATSNNAWIPEFRDFCEKNNVPYDFISTHHYPSDDPLSTAGMNGPGIKGEGFGVDFFEKMFAGKTKEEIQAFLQEFTHHENNNPRDILAQLTRKAKEEAGDYPLYYTEWNAGYYDTSYAAAAITATIAYNEGLVEGYSYWCISDIFEESGLHGLPFNNEFGLVNVYGIPKPAYRLFQMMHQAGDRRLEVISENPNRTAEVLALADEHQVVVFAYNHDIEMRDIKSEDMEIIVKGKAQRIQKAVIDNNHTNPLACWEAQGKPTYPTEQQLEEIRNASQLVMEDIEVKEDENVLSFTAEPESVTVFFITK